MLGYVARRLNVPAGALVTQRTEPNHANASWLQRANPTWIERIALGPPSFGGLRALVAERIGHHIPRHAIMRITEMCDGNLFYTPEMARAIHGQSRNGEPELRDSLSELTRTRLSQLDEDVRCGRSAPATS